MSTDSEFLDEIHASPYDDTPRLIYADWLEEHGDPRGEYLRIECELNGLSDGDALFDELAPRLRDLRQDIDPAWLADVGRTKIGNCLVVAFECPKRWEQLKPTGHDQRRFCTACKEVVHYCSTFDEAMARARNGECVAIDAVTSSETSLAALAAERQLALRSDDFRGLLGHVVPAEPSS